MNSESMSLHTPGPNVFRTRSWRVKQLRLWENVLDIRKSFPLDTFLLVREMGLAFVIEGDLVTFMF